MSDSIMPETFDEWRHCITVACGIPLTLKFVEERIKSLADASDFRTRQFVELYGSAYHAQVVTWFNQAKSELEQATT